MRNVNVWSVPAHGVVALLLQDAGDEPAGIQPPCASWRWCTDQNGTRIDVVGLLPSSHYETWGSQGDAL